jgi:Zn-dependent M32 family carboxypeptidase
MATATQNQAVENIVQNATKAAAKKENYSAETTAALLKAYETEKNTETLAKMFGKTAKSIVAKLSREKVYVKATYKTKTGEQPVSKQEIVAEIAILVNQSEEVLESLEKATKPALLIIQDALELQADLLEAEPEEGDSFEQLSANDGTLTTDAEVVE